MSSFCGPAIFSASFTARCTSCSDMSWVRACCDVGAGGGGGGGGGGASTRARPPCGTLGADAIAGVLDACVAEAGRSPWASATGERFCVEERRVPLCEKRESRSDSARSAACATVCSAAEVCAWICTRMFSSRRSSASFASEVMASQANVFFFARQHGQHGVDDLVVAEASERAHDDRQ